MFLTRSTGVQATRVLQEQNRKEQLMITMRCNQHPTTHNYYSPPSTGELPIVGNHSPKKLDLTTDSNSSQLSSPSSGRLPLLSSQASSPSHPSPRGGRLISPSRRTFHMSPNQRHQFYDRYIDRPSTVQIPYAKQWL